MITLDLHGIYHSQVELLVENFVLLEELPVRVITGNSFQMQRIVKEVLIKYNLNWRFENDFNLGSVIVF